MKSEKIGMRRVTGVVWKVPESNAISWRNGSRDVTARLMRGTLVDALSCFRG